MAPGCPDQATPGGRGNKLYVSAIRENLPRAFIVFDRFHIVQHLNRAVDEVRRECWRRLTGEEKSAFKQTRWLWLKNPWNLTRRETEKDDAMTQQNRRPLQMSGKTVDDAYLIQVEENALGLLKLRGEAIAAGDDARGQVDRQNRLMTLCINAQREIKLFAEMAFYDDTERYNKFYASATIRQQRKDAVKKPGQPLV